jgi:hypothetical protein
MPYYWTVHQSIMIIWGLEIATVADWSHVVWGWWVLSADESDRMVLPVLNRHSLTSGFDSRQMHQSPCDSQRSLGTYLSRASKTSADP